ncbi:MAG TPA: DoxX family protein [Pseudomonadales bacterium]|nr:DoxX family protein [Pseudomonadales bacterium]
MKVIVHCYDRVTAALLWLSPLSLFSFRLWVAIDFWNAGRVKIADMNGTISLFEYVYHVPILPPVAAAWIGTLMELILPWFLGLGLATRVTAGILFVYNIIAVISYPDLWPGGLWHDFLHGGFIDHKVWALMLLASLLLGPGKLSVDHLIRHWLLRGAPD